MTTRNQSLDVLRGVAVLMVMAAHYVIVIPHGELTLLTIGGAGVDLFFVLSGFLISGLLFAEFKETGTIDVKRFWIRRGLKIYPGFYCFIAITSMIAIYRTTRLPRETFTELLFVQNYFPHLWPHTWTLAVEEHFYFSLPLMFLLLIKIGKGNANPFRAIPAISVALSAVCLYLRISAMRNGGDWSHVAFPTHLRIDALFSGVVLGYFFHFDQTSFREEARRWWVLVIGLMFVSTFFFLPDVPRLTFAYVAFCFIVAWAVAKTRDSRIAKPLAWVGRYSYSIYLWHVAAMFVLQQIPGRWYRFPSYILLTILLGYAMAKLIEMPVLKLRERLFPSFGHHAVVLTPNSAALTADAVHAAPVLGSASMMP